jgi:uncharacterized membrane protein YkoI
MKNPIRKPVAIAAIALSTLGGAAAGATFISAAGAQDATTTTTATSATEAPNSQNAPAPPSGQAGFDPSKGGHQANGITETVLTGDEATKVSEAASAAVSGGTVDRVETDAEGAAFEAHVTKADGTRVTVKLDSSYKVTSVEDGMA